MSASVRGIGVAVMWRTCGRARPTSAERCSTPKRCCSSTTATARSRNSTPSWISACVPTTTSAPSAALALALARRAREQRAADAELEAEIRRREKVLLSEGFSRRHQRPLTAALDGAQERVQRDDRLAGADVSLQEPLHRDGAREVAVDLADRLLLVRRQRERQRLAVAVDEVAGLAERRSERPLPFRPRAARSRSGGRAAPRRRAAAVPFRPRRGRVAGAPPRARRASAPGPRAHAARPEADRGNASRAEARRPPRAAPSRRRSPPQPG